ncbi:hypothetical protein [Campylobacter sp. RM16187]|uniref:hypothetical protein n=1 Tax=Campylobacter sp. RM16187 TaxID=1660063 RepID=UPI0021B60E57|nr:hypothetical protein [Campylobacter sp. RM16187]QKG28721.1 putative membrane protein [Campylobacter sp. RM16187]
MLAFILILIISFTWAIVINQIYLSNLNKILKLALMLTCLIISGVSTLFSIFLTPLFLSIFQKRQIKFDKRVAFVLAVLLSAVSFIDVKNRIVYEYKCNIEKDYEIRIVKQDYKKEDIDEFYIDWISYSRPKSVQKIHTINVYNKFQGSVVAEVYTIYLPNGFIANELHKMTVGGNESGINCGYIDWNSGFILRDQIKQILKDKR